MNKLYIQPIHDNDDSEVYMPSSNNSTGLEMTPEMIADLKQTLQSFVAALVEDPIEGWSIDQIELGISFSSDVKAWIINVGGSGTMKITLKPTK